MYGNAALQLLLVKMMPAMMLVLMRYSPGAGGDEEDGTDDHGQDDVADEGPAEK